MARIATLADKLAVETEMPWQERWRARSLYEQLVETAGRSPDRRAIAFQLRSGPKDKVVALTWAGLKAEVTRAANLLRRLGVGSGDTVAFVLPNGIEAPMLLIAGATAGVVNPVNPLLAPEHMAGILRDTRAKVVVTLAPFPKTDLAERVAVLDIDLPGIDGMQLLALLRGKAEGVALIAVAVTARSGADTERRCTEAGFDHFMRKPVSAEQFVAAASRWRAALSAAAGR